MDTVVPDFLLGCKCLSVAFLSESRLGWNSHVWASLPSFKISLPLFLAIKSAGEKSRVSLVFVPVMLNCFFYLNVSKVLSLSRKFRNYILAWIILQALCMLAGQGRRWGGGTLPIKSAYLL